MEFVNYGELHENLRLGQAVDLYKKVTERGTASGPGIGFLLQDNQVPDYSEVHWPIFQCGEIAKDEIDMIAAYREHPLVEMAVRELETYLPKLKADKRSRKKNMETER